MLVVALLIANYSLKSQSFKFGTITADVGVGFGLYGISSHSPVNNEDISGIGLIGTLPCVDAEFGLLRFIGVGVHYRRGTYGGYKGGKIRGTDFCPMVDFHVANKKDKFDLVLGVGYGFSNMNTPNIGSESLKASGGLLRVQIAPHIYFGKYVGMFIRVAYNQHMLNNNIELIDSNGKVYTQADGATWNMAGVEFNFGVAAKFDIFKKKEESK